MQYDLFRSGHDPDLRLNFQNYLLRLNYSPFDASQQEKHDTGKISTMNFVLSVSQKLLQKNLFFAKTAIFGVFALWRPNR